MTFGTYPYNDEIRAIFASIDEHVRQTKIAQLQGKRYAMDTYITWLENTTYTQDDLRRIIDDLCEDKEFRNLILQWQHREYKNNITWDFYLMYSIPTNVEFLPEKFRCWQCVLLQYVYDLYKQETKQLYPAYYANNPLERYYRSKGTELNMSDNYGLINTADFEINYKQGAKLYDKRLDTHIFIKFIPEPFIAYLLEEQKKSSFKLALRPDYEICGDGILDIQRIDEQLIQGNKQPLQIDSMPSLTWLCDDETSSDRLIVSHNQQSKDITFEEILAEPLIENDYIITQVVHLIYTKEKSCVYINHIDHEYVFYTTDEHSEKMINLRRKGEARPRYKTFKIDDARIPYRTYCDQNILYRTLDAYFTNKDMLKEYFEAMINMSGEE